MVVIINSRTAIYLRNCDLLLHESGFEVRDHDCVYAYYSDVV